MKTSRALSVYLIRDITKFSGMSFKYPDRLTQAEADRVAAWARANPAVASAYIDKAHPENRSVRLYADMLEHYLIDHPQTDTGEPASWSASERAIATNAYGVRTAEEADAFLQWAQTVPEYRVAFEDPKHPLHKDYVAQTQELRELALPQVHVEAEPTAQPAAARPSDQVPAVQSGGLSPARIAELAQEDRERSSPSGQARLQQGRIKELMAHPAYLDGRHPEHKTVVARVTAAYAEAYPPPAGDVGGAPGVPAHRGSALPPPRQTVDRVAELRKNPAYLDGRHPGHKTAVASVTAAYAEAYPEPAGSGVGNDQAGGAT